MPSPRRRATAPRASSQPEGARAQTSHRHLRLIGALCAAATMLSLGGVLSANAGPGPGCVAAQSTRANGAVVEGSACADRIVVTSPLVKKVLAGAGDDVVYANSDVVEIYGGDGDDVVFGDLPQGAVTSPPAGVEYEPGAGIDYEPAAEDESPLASASNTVMCESSPCFGGDGNQEMFGGAGADQLFGQRGNDSLHGEAGQDTLFGGIGDDIIKGGDGQDVLAGSLGTDTLDGNEGTDHMRGDGTVDILRDTGAQGEDTLSFSTAVAPGFRGAVPVEGFPADDNGEERGISLRLDGALADCGTQMCNNDARYGGGGDEISVAGIERVIGSPFADYIIGSDRKDVIFGGGGNDALIGNRGNDVLYGGGEADYLNGGGDLDTAFDWGANNCAEVEAPNGCTGSSASVSQRDRAKISVGRMTTTLLLGGYRWESFYVVGSSTADNVSVKQVAGQPYYLVFTAEPGSAQFDTSDAGGCTYTPTVVKCAIGYLSSRVDSLMLAGMAGDDRLSISGEPEWEATVSPVLLGGQGSDVLYGSGRTEDLLVDGDGAGNDTLYGLGLDDALLNNEGSDSVQAGLGSDLLLSASTCGGDTLQGAENKNGDEGDVNNASWSQLPESSGAVVADLSIGTAGGQYIEVADTSSATSSSSATKGGKKGAGRRAGRPTCATGSVDRLQNIDDLEGSSQSDAFYGDALPNNLLGRKGQDSLYGRGGDDRIAAKDGEPDKVSGGGGSEDLCIVDEDLDTVDGCDL